MDDETERRLGEALCAGVDALTSDGIDALVVGGIALTHHLDGTARVDHDVDLFIRQGDVEPAMAALTRRGFEVVATHPTWLFKARLEGALVDVLYNLGRVLTLDDEMMRRAPIVDVAGCSVPVVSREDLAVAQAGVGSRETPNHWFEAVNLLRADDIDWPYLVQRGAAWPERAMALLHFARSDGIEVPDEAFMALSIPH